MHPYLDRARDVSAEDKGCSVRLPRTDGCDSWERRMSDPVMSWPCLGCERRRGRLQCQTAQTGRMQQLGKAHVRSGHVSIAFGM